MTKTMGIWLAVGAAVVVAALAVVIVLLVVIAGQNSRAAEQDEFDRIVEICADELGPLTEDNLAEHVECRERLLN